MKRRSLFQAAGAFLLAGVIASGCGSGGGSDEGNEPVTRALPNPFHAFHFSMEALPPDQQIALLEELGYRGIAYLGVAEPLDGYLAQPAVRDGRIKVSAVGVTPVIYDAAEPFSRALVEQTCQKLAGTGATIWFQVQSATRPFSQPAVDASDQQAAVAVRELADIAATHGVTAVIYPHDGDYVSTAEHALRVLRLTGRDRPSDNLKLALHLCHELRAGNGDRLAEVIAATLPFIAVTSLCGADRAMHPRGSSDWSDVIQVLGEGDYDVEGGFLRPLAQAEYTGPIILHTYGVPGDPRDTLTHSHNAWNAMSTRVATAIG